MEPWRSQQFPLTLILPLLLAASLAVTTTSCVRKGKEYARQDSVERYLEGRRLYTEQRFDEALEVLLENQRRDPGFSENSYLIGKIRYFRREYVQARQVWASTLERNPHHLDTRKWLARLHLAEGSPFAAEQLIAAALADSAEDPELLILLGKCRRAQRDPAGAIECYRKAQVLAERLAEASLELAELYREFGMPERAAQELQRAASLLPAESGLSQAVEAATERLQRE